jgi:PAS domain S-box-containing protein/putative nucleotidyltransferase with HDIG domain
VVSDIVMPGMDGYELCRRIKADPERHDIQVILLTSLTEPEVVIRALQSGADKFITKPFDEAHLLSTVESLFRDRGLQADEDAHDVITVSYRGRAYDIGSDRRQVLTLLLSTYETAMVKNLALIEAQDELRSLNRDLEAMVQRRTEALTAEVTERRQAQESLLRERNTLDRIMETSPAGILMVTREGRFVFANRRAQEILGRSLQQITGLHADSSEWRLTGHEGESLAVDDLALSAVLSAGDPVHGVKLATTRPDGRVVYLSVNAAPLADETGAVTDVVLTIDDVTEQRRSDEAVQAAMVRLRDSVNGTVRSMATLVETRDPYTAGHQERVAELAQSIAAELGLAQERIDGLRVAGIIHDVGKTAVPTELLVKPTRLSGAEMDIIKVHAQAGYEILKDIDFPWPVARMVHEHHERIDGSGYPNGLPGGDLLLESRILAVADVVESMAAHRPYRPSLGLEAALAEVREQRGVLYDPDVADACCRLFEEKGFALE